ncbi:MAG: molybdate ABC transporter permease subunit [Eggerthellaceae bacterium]|nr:molybdate ABC transporter permease subunit [Eggerthellaceae bacterium]
MGKSKRQSKSGAKRIADVFKASVVRRVLLASLLAVSVLVFGSVAFAAEPGEVEVSADGSTARLETSSFALQDFSRAQVGSSRSIEGEYHGYLYLAGSESGLMAALATHDAVVVYVPDAATLETSFDIANPSDKEALKQLLIVLDAQAAKGARVLSDELDWHFTNEQRFVLGSHAFFFDQELKKNEFYAGIIGDDGSDITDTENPLYLKRSHANFARFINADDAVIVVPKTGFVAFIEFLSSIDYSPLWVTLKTTGTAIIIVFILGLAAAYFSLRIPARAQDIADSIFTIPMVLPPTVCGFLLLLLFGKNTGIGKWFIDIGFPLIFSWQATVLAATVVAFPLMYRSARGAFEGLDANMLDAARTLGWSNSKIFFRLMLPLAWSSIAAGTVLAFARALGEFGATLFLAGNYLGVTRTIPIAMYFEWMNGHNEVAIFWTIVIIAISFIVILLINLWGRKTTKYRRRGML